MECPKPLQCTNIPKIRIPADVRAKISRRMLGNKNALGYHRSEEECDKIRKRMLGNKITEGRPPWNKGKSLSIETRAKMSAVRKGKPTWNKGKFYSAETKARMNSARKGIPSPLKGRPGKPHSAETKAKMSAAHKGQIPWSKGKSLSAETRAKISAANAGRSPSEKTLLAIKGKHRSEEIKRKISLAHTRRFANPVIRAERSEMVKRLWQNSEYRRDHVAAWMKAMRIRPNKIETLLGQFLDELFLGQYCYTGNGQVILGGRCPDFVNVNGQKKLIELYGDYWHRGENPQDRIEFFAAFGFQTLVIWEHELSDLEVLSQKLMKFHNEE